MCCCNRQTLKLLRTPAPTSLWLFRLHLLAPGGNRVRVPWRICTGHSGKSFPSCSRHCNSVTGPCLAARELTNAGTCVLRKKGKLGYTVKACKREKSLHFPMSELQRPYRGGWDYVESFIFVSFPSRSGKVSLFKKKRIMKRK